MSGLMWQVAEVLAQGFPLPPPEPAPGCEDCARYAELIKSATQGRDLSAATDLRVLMTRHLQGAH